MAQTTRISSLPFSVLRGIQLDKKQAAALKKQLAASEGVDVRTIQRRFTSGKEKRGQNKNLTTKSVGVIRKWFDQNPVVDDVLDENPHENLLMQEIYRNQKEADARAKQLQQFIEDGPDVETDDLDMYQGSIFQNIRRIQVIYVPQGGKYRTGRIYQKDPKDWTVETAPPGGVWLVRVFN